jgi:predicted RNA-binding protein with PIN domain
MREWRRFAEALAWKIMGRVRLIVDGMNVIGSRPDGWWRDRRGAMLDLVRKLEAYASDTGDEVTVVFDSRPFELPTNSAAGLRVAFASPPTRNAADDEIVRMLEQDPDPRSLAVVTSDAELAGRVEARGAAVVGAGGFRRRIDPV